MFELGDERREAPCAAIECLDESLLSAFCALSVDLSERLTGEGRRPSPAEVSAALADWERLLRSRRRLSEVEEMGLWGELAMIERLPDVDDAIRCWRGPFGDTVDFLSNNVGLEVKTSLSRLQHYVSYEQVHRSIGNPSSFFVSVWVGVDAQAGRTVSELVEAIRRRTTVPIEFEQSLLAVGYSGADSASYTTRYVLFEDPHWFSSDTVPRIGQIDPGITHIRYTVVLDELRALDEKGIAALMTRLRRSTSTE